MYVAVDEAVKLNVQDLGKGRPVVLVAGFGLDHRIWDRQVSDLTASGYRTVCIDQRGHGRSSKPLEGYDLARLAADLRAVIQALDLDNVTLVGHSFGGQVCFAAAAASPERISGLVLVGSNAVRASRSADFPFGAPSDALLPGLLAAETDDRIGSRRRSLASAFAEPSDDALLSWLLAISLEMPSWAAKACYTAMLEGDLLDAMPAVRLPVLQVVGTADPVHSAKGARWLQERLARARLVELAGCGHYPMFEAANDFEHALQSFLPLQSAGS